MNALILLAGGVPFPVLLVFIALGGGLFYFLISQAQVLVRKYSTPAPELVKVGACLERQAAKRGGAVKSDEYGQPKLTFRDDDAEFSVSVLEGSSRSDMCVTFATFQTDFFPDRDFRIASGQFKVLVSFTRIKNFSGAASRKYDFEGSDGEFIKHLMTEEIQNNLLDYQPATEVRFGTHAGIKYALKPAAGRFYLSTEGFQIEDEYYDRLIETTVEFYERLKIMATENK